MNIESNSSVELHLDGDGLPILDEVIEESDMEELAADIKAQLMAELKPQIEDIAVTAMTEAIKAGALELKHSFESRFGATLERRVGELVEQAVDRACAPGR